jgi:hypothetical protein
LFTTSRIVGAIAGCLCLSAAAHGEGSSSLRPGLWSVAMSATGKPDRLATYRMCIDHASERRLVTHTSEPLPEYCSKYETEFTSTGAIIDTVCTQVGGTTTTHRVVTYTGDTAYTMTMHAQRVWPNAPSSEDTLSEKGTWQGACPPSMKPGDMTQMTVTPK